MLDGQPIDNKLLEYQIAKDENHGTYMVKYKYCSVKDRDIFIDMMDKFLNKYPKYNCCFDYTEVTKNNDKYEYHLAPISFDNLVRDRDGNYVTMDYHKYDQLSHELSNVTSKDKYVIIPKSNVFLHCTINQVNVGGANVQKIEKGSEHGKNIKSFKQYIQDNQLYASGQIMTLQTLLAKYNTIYPELNYRNFPKYAKNIIYNDTNQKDPTGKKIIQII